MTKHLCIKKEDGLYINGAKCTDGFIEGREYSESEFETKGLWEHDRNEETYGSYLGQSAILIPALKEESGEEEHAHAIKSLEFAIQLVRKHRVTVAGLGGLEHSLKSNLRYLQDLQNNYTITKK